MNITINGKTQPLADNLNLNEIIKSILEDCSKVIAEYNGEIIKKENWSKIAVKNGDKIELVSFVGGG